MTPPHVVKVCGITNAEDAVAAADAGATALGFNFWPGSPRYVEPITAAELVARVAGLPGGPLAVGVFVDASPEEVTRIAQRAGVSVVQIHGGGCSGLRCWRACRVSDDGTVAIDVGGDAEAILLDTAAPGLRGGTGRPFPWRVARDVRRPVIIAGGLHGGNVREAIRQARPWGVDACSRIESAPGRKDHQKMKAFITEALAEFA
jgi:phosphoribosylanthranilate isomerase